MAKNENLSDLDAGQLFKKMVDGEHDAIRVVNAFNMEMAIALSAEENDSVQAVARSRSIKPEDGEVNCSSLRRVCSFGSTDFEISPDGELWVPRSALNQEIIQLCAMKIKVTSGILVGQS